MWGRRQSGAGRSRCHVRGIARAVGVSRCLHSNADALTRDMQYGRDVARRVLGDRKDDARLSNSETNLELPKKTGASRRESKLRKTLRDRVVNSHDGALAERERKVRVHRRRKEQVWTLPVDSPR